MNPKQVSFKIGLAVGFVIATICQASFPQRPGPDSKIIAEFERRIERSDLVDLDRPLVEFAIANPNNVQALELLARLRLRQGRLTESRALYQRVLRLDPGSAAAKINSARIAFALGRQEEARQFLTGITRDASLSTAHRMELAAAYLLINDPQSALEIANTLPAVIRDTTALPLLAEIYLRLNRRDAFSNLVPLMKKAGPKDPALAVECANVLRNAGLYRDGIGLLLSLPLRAQNNARVLLTLGRLEVMAQDFVRAREHLKRAARVEPNSAEVLSAQAYVASTTGSLDEALRLMTRAREIAPRSTVVLSDFVALTLRVGKPALAFEAAKTLAELEPDNSEFQYLLGVASLQSGNFGPAQETLELYIRKHPSDFRGCLALGMVLTAQRDMVARARSQLGRCIEIDPSNAEARYQLGLLHRSQGENKQAIAVLEEAVNLAPNYVQAVRDLGALYLESGEDKTARGLLERAASLNPKDGETHFQLVRLYNSIGERELAKQHQEIFQKLRGLWGKQAQ